MSKPAEGSKGEYGKVVKGSLKLKSGLRLKVDTEEKLKKSKSKRKRRASSQDKLDSIEQRKSDQRTRAEILHEKISRERETKKLRTQASESHREKISRYNKYLASLSEHHDVPKVGNAGMG